VTVRTEALKSTYPAILGAPLRAIPSSHCARGR